MPGQQEAWTRNSALRDLRIRRGLSQEGLAAAVRRAGWGSCDRRTVQRWESGQTASPQYGARRALESVLGVSFSQMGFAGPGIAEEADVNRRELLAIALAGAAGGVPPCAHDPALVAAAPSAMAGAHTAAAWRGADQAPDQPQLAPLASALLSAPVRSEDSRGSLGGEAARIWKLRQASRYQELAADLPQILARARGSEDDRGRAGRPTGLAPLTHLYNAASSLAKSMGSFELAGIAAERAVQAAGRAGDPLLAGAAAYRMANVLLTSGHLGAARAVAVDAADQLRPVMTATVSHTSMWGALLATAAQAAARGHAAVDAWELMGASKVAADLLPTEQADLFSVFGTASWMIHGVSIAADLGDGTGAIRRADQVPLGRLPPFLTERRTFLLLAMARGHALRNDAAAATQLLLEAERAAPEEVRHSPEARRLARHLLSACPGRSRPLIGLKARMETGTTRICEPGAAP
jgi:transcriptional regulator with XRE-family HTH domain